MEFYDIRFFKMTATGNDFLFVNLVDQVQKKSFDDMFKDRSHAAKTLCDRHFGLGADGLVLVENSDNQETDLKWDFYNSDGSSAEMCGNAARCMVIFVQQFKLCTLPFSFMSHSGKIDGDFNDELPRVTMTAVSEHSDGHYMPYEHSRAQQIETGGEGLYYSLINSGVPHAVIEMQMLMQDQQTSDIGEFFQKHDTFQPESLNVTFYSPSHAEEISAFTFERGVGDFTLSCGTGAVAAAQVHFKKMGLKEPIVRVNVPGGTLFVDLTNNRPKLSGEAHFVGEFKMIKRK